MVSKTKSKRKKILTKIEKALAEFGKKMKPQDIIDIILYGTVAYYGFRAIPDDAPIEHKVGGSAVAMVSLKLAMSPNMVAGASGVVGLSVVGLANVIGADLLSVVPDVIGYKD